MNYCLLALPKYEKDNKAVISRREDKQAIQFKARAINFCCETKNQGREQLTGAEAGGHTRVSTDRVERNRKKKGSSVTWSRMAPGEPYDSREPYSSHTAVRLPYGLGYMAKIPGPQKKFKV